MGHVARDKIEKNKTDGMCGTYGGEEVCTGVWWGNLRERDRLGDPDIDGWIILRWSFRKWDVRVWTVSSWVRIGTDGGYLLMR